MPPNITVTAKIEIVSQLFFFIPCHLLGKFVHPTLQGCRRLELFSWPSCRYFFPPFSAVCSLFLRSGLMPKNSVTSLCISSPNVGSKIGRASCRERQRTVGALR